MPTETRDETWLRKELNELRGAAFAMSLVVFATIGCLLGYFLFSETLVGPFKNIAYAQSGSTMEVKVETRVPTRARVEYGTAPEYLNKKEMDEKYQTDHEIMVSGVLPGKPHFFRVILEDQSGRFHTSAFYTVK